MTIDIKIINTTFPRNTIPSYWFPEKIRITDTMIIDNFTSDIEPNAFHTIAFRKAMTLHFNMPLEILRNGSLNGLPKLRKLVLQSTKIRIIEMEMPGTIALKNVAVCELDFDAEQIVRLLDLFKANLVQSIRINKNNLLRKVTRDLFSKFSNLTTLALYENNIAEIESQSFDAFGETLMYINLRQNLLKTLPDRVFPEAFLADQASIVKLVALQDNPWDCNCDLNYLKTVQIAYRKRFLIKPLCYTPLSLRDKRVVEVDLCNEGVEVTVCCRSGDDSIAKIKLLENRLMRAVVSPKGELEIHVKSISSIHAMIWLENEPPETETFSIAQCVITRNTSAFTSIKKLESGKIYKFCLIEKLANKLSPINCMLYRNIQSNAPDVGLDDDMRLCVAVAAVCVCILAAFAGAGLTIISSKYFYKRNAVDFGGNRNFSERFVLIFIYHISRSFKQFFLLLSQKL